jgi:hypothetical protein
MATTIRAGLTQGLASDVGISYLVLLGWAAVSGALALRALGRRR